MNSRRIAEVLAALNASSCPVLAREACALLAELCAPDGAVGIADEAAFELLGSECFTEELDGVVWYHIEEPSIFSLGVLHEGDDGELMARTVRYLARRELLEAHPENPRLVRRS